MTTADCEWVDTLPGDLRRCVHDYGAAPVRILVNCGVTKANQIRAVIGSIYVASAEPGNKRRPARNKIETMLDDILAKHSAPPIAREIIAVLRSQNITILPCDAIPCAIEASMEAIEGMGLLKKARKHEIRLRTALVAADRHLWGERV